MSPTFDTTAAIERLMAAGENPAGAAIIAAKLAEIVAGCLARASGVLLTTGMQKFDTLEHAKSLMAAGVSRELAEAHARVMWDLVLEPLRQEERRRRQEAST